MIAFKLRDIFMQKGKYIPIKSTYCILFIITIIGLPFFLLGTNAYLIIHDNLDSEFVYLHLLKITGSLSGFDGDQLIYNVMNGLPKKFFHSEFSFIRFLFYLFPSFWAYIINSILVRLIGFIGLYLFLKDYLMKQYNKNIVIILAVIFSMIPLYPLFGLTVTGQPILIWSFLNLANHRKYLISWMVIALFPFYSHFALIGPFILSILVVFGIYLLITKNRNTSVQYHIGIGLLTACFIIANFITIKGFLDPGEYVSFRTAWIFEPYSFENIARQFIITFFTGQYHASLFNTIPIFLYALLVLFFMKIKPGQKKVIISLILAIALITALKAVYPLICYILQNTFNITLSFQIGRFFFFNPFLWFILLAVTIIYTYNRIPKYVLYSLITIQFVVIIYSNKELTINYEKLFAKEQVKYNYPSFCDFYASDLFSEISRHIGLQKKEYRIVSLGIHPAIAQYNGFFTLDSYQNNYLLRYKQEFREIIETELLKNNELKKYFDNWGGRCYLFSDELERSCKQMCLKECGLSIKQLDINIMKIKAMGGKYIFSALPIENSDELQIKLCKKFEDDHSLWDIYLYKLNNIE
ncbi:MAG: DUF6044 family protein [Bacteroidales bacterium]|jgi:hypothetical protein|nr:DUF6044 family protein [Bacteroidales bacterium]